VCEKLIDNNEKRVLSKASVKRIQFVPL